MSPTTAVPAEVTAGLGWPGSVRWGRSLGWPGDLAVPRETGPGPTPPRDRDPGDLLASTTALEAAGPDPENASDTVAADHPPVGEEEIGATRLVVRAGGEHGAAVRPDAGQVNHPDAPSAPSATAAPVGLEGDRPTGIVDEPASRRSDPSSDVAEEGVEPQLKADGADPVDEPADRPETGLTVVTSATSAAEPNRSAREALAAPPAPSGVAPAPPVVAASAEPGTVSRETAETRSASGTPGGRTEGMVAPDDRPDDAVPEDDAGHDLSRAMPPDPRDPDPRDPDPGTAEEHRPALAVITARPPSPRRARFDRDEFDTGGSDGEQEPRPASPAAPRKATLPRPRTSRVFVVANQKGGVGKTTTSVNLAAALALGGLNVLVIDLDPQGNASTALGVDHPPGTSGTYEVLIEGAAIADHLMASPEAPQLKVLPATIDLAGAEIQLVSTVARENRLRKALRTYLAENPVDYVFLDCPPSLGLITLNALVAASEILIPIQCEYYALEGVSQLVRTINLVKGELNEDLQVSTVLLTMYDARTRLAAQVADEVRAYFTEQTLPTVIPRSVRISEAPSYGQTVLTYHPDSAGAVSYLEAAQEIARRGAKEIA